jgi:hypothetical protein
MAPTKAWVQISTGEVFTSDEVSYENWGHLILHGLAGRGDQDIQPPDETAD